MQVNDIQIVLLMALEGINILDKESAEIALDAIRAVAKRHGEQDFLEEQLSYLVATHCSVA